MGKFLKTFAYSVSRPKAGVGPAWVQWVHLHPSILSNGYIAPVLMNNHPNTVPSRNSGPINSGFSRYSG